jgi:hypothetical protein
VTTAYLKDVEDRRFVVFNAIHESMDSRALFLADPVRAVERALNQRLVCSGRSGIAQSVSVNRNGIVVNHNPR